MNMADRMRRTLAGGMEKPGRLAGLVMSHWTNQAVSLLSGAAEAGVRAGNPWITLRSSAGACRRASAAGGRVATNRPRASDPVRRPRATAARRWVRDMARPFRVRERWAGSGGVRVAGGLLGEVDH